MKNHEKPKTLSIFELSFKILYYKTLMIENYSIAWNRGFLPRRNWKVTPR